MINQDFVVEFDLLFNNALSNSAPEINGYEKSMFFTQAQDEIVRDLYKGKPGDAGFEANEIIRRRLAPLLTPASTSYDSGLNNGLSASKIDANSKFFTIADDTWYIGYETITNGSSERYVVPVTLDEYSVLSDNPFKNPNDKRAWRLDLNNTVDGDRMVEVVTNLPASGSVYHYRYLKQPTPIVLEDLSINFPGYSIEGITAETECKLPKEMHRPILKRAVELATLAYKENTLQNNVQLNTRIN